MEGRQEPLEPTVALQTERKVELNWTDAQITQIPTQQLILKSDSS